MNNKLSLIKIYGQLFKAMLQMMYGAWKIKQLPQPRVTIFGGSRLPKDSIYFKQAHEIAHKLGAQNISVITGGGPGIMEAANCGIFPSKEKARSIGISVKGLEREGEIINPCAQERMVVDYFFVRKWLMINYSVAFAVFPGGFGTIDELGEVITLIQTKKLPGVPVILIGTKYWQPFMTWVTECALYHGLVSESDVHLLRMTDDIDEAVELLKEQCEICK